MTEKEREERKALIIKQLEHQGREAVAALLRYEKWRLAQEYGS